MGFDFLSKAEFAAGLDDDLRGKAPPEYRIRHVPALGPLGRERGTTNDASGLALAIHGSKMGSGT